MRIKQNKLLLLPIVGMILSGCDSVNQKYNQFIEQKAEESTVVESEETTEVPEKLVDIRLVPEFVQVEEAVKAIDNLEIGEEIYRTSQTITQSQDKFDISVNQMVVYEAKSDDQLLGIKSTDSDEGAIVIVNVAITNKTTETFYFPIDELKLSYPNAPVARMATSGLYPLQSGNLYEILLSDNHGAISPTSTVEGYLVYSLTKEDFEHIKEQNAFNLTVVPPRLDADSIVGLSSTDLGYVLPLYLPLTDTIEQELVDKNKQIQDRISAEWWGHKEILADEILEEKDTDGEVDFTLKRIEISDFTPKENYEETFQYFPNGQVIVSLQIEIDNQSEHTLLPTDSLVNLVINGDTIQSDYILINELYGEHLEPGEKRTIIKTFALDKYTYQQNWQNQDVQIYIQVSPDDSIDNQDATTTVEESTEVEQVEEFMTGDESEIIVGEEIGEATELMYVGNFVWEPKLVKYINEDLEVVDELASEEADNETTEMDNLDDVDAILEENTTEAMNE